MVDLNSVTYNDLLNFIKNEVKVPENFKFLNEPNKEKAKDQEFDILLWIRDCIDATGVPFGACTSQRWAELTGQEYNPKFDSQIGDIVFYLRDPEGEVFENKDHLPVRIMSLDVKAPIIRPGQKGLFYGTPTALSLKNFIDTIEATKVPALYMCIGSDRSFKLVGPRLLKNALVNSKNGKDAFLMMHTPYSSRVNDSSNKVGEFNGKMWFFKDRGSRVLSNANDDKYFVYNDDFVSTFTIKTVDCEAKSMSGTLTESGKWKGINLGE